MAGRQDSSFGPGSTPDYNVTLGLFLPFSGPGSSSVKCAAGKDEA